MTTLRINRRQFLATTAMTGAISSLGLLPVKAASDRLAVRFTRDISALDPGYTVGESPEFTTLRAVMPELAEFTFEGDTTSWQPTAYAKSLVQRDATHIDFELNPGFEWSNGFGELTADDVKYSLERMKTTEWSGYFETLDRVDVKDRYAGTIVLNQPFSTPFIMTALANGPGVILSRKATEEAGGKFDTEIPATCGPYVYEWQPGQRVVFKPNPAWSGPRPAFDEVYAKVISEDKSAELAYEAGEVDCTTITASALARYRKEGLPEDSKVTVAGYLNYLWMGMNTEHPKLKDIRVRKALQHAIDAKAIIDGAYGGTTKQSYGIVCPGLIGKRDQTNYQYDPAKAREMLSKAGAKGLKIELRTLNVNERLLAAQIIQVQLQEIGVQVNVLPMDSGPFWEMGQESKGDMWKELETWLMEYTSAPDPSSPTQWFVSDQVGIWNWERWKDPEYDRLYQEGIAETDPEKRDRIYKRMQEIMENTGAYVWINHRPDPLLHRANLYIETTPAGDLNLRKFAKV